MTINMRSDHFRTEIETVTIQLERRFEYDATFMRDRFVYLARSGSFQGYSALGLGHGALAEHRDDVMDVVRDRLPAMRRTAIDGALKLGYEKDLRDAGDTILRQANEIRFLRARRWWHPVRDWSFDFWQQMKATFQ